MSENLNILSDAAVEKIRALLKIQAATARNQGSARQHYQFAPRPESTQWVRVTDATSHSVYGGITTYSGCVCYIDPGNGAWLDGGPCLVADASGAISGLDTTTKRIGRVALVLNGYPVFVVEAEAVTPTFTVGVSYGDGTGSTGVNARTEIVFDRAAGFYQAGFPSGAPNINDIFIGLGPYMGTQAWGMDSLSFGEVSGTFTTYSAGVHAGDAKLAWTLGNRVGYVSTELRPFVYASGGKTNKNAGFAASHFATVADGTGAAGALWLGDLNAAAPMSSGTTTWVRVSNGGSAGVGAVFCVSINSALTFAWNGTDIRLIDPTGGTGPFIGQTITTGGLQFKGGILIGGSFSGGGSISIGNPVGSLPTPSAEGLLLVDGSGNLALSNPTDLKWDASTTTLTADNIGCSSITASNVIATTLSIGGVQINWPADATGWLHNNGTGTLTWADVQSTLGADSISYSPTTPTDWGASPPSDIGPALNELASITACAHGAANLVVFTNLAGTFSTASTFSFNGTVLQTPSLDVTTDLGVFGKPPRGQFGATGVTSGFTVGSGSTILAGSTFTGGTGTTAYTISDIVAALKAFGFLAS